METDERCEEKVWQQGAWRPTRCRNRANYLISKETSDPLKYKLCGTHKSWFLRRIDPKASVTKIERG